MPTYCALLGHQPHISLAELCVLLPDSTVKRIWNQHIITLETQHILDQEWLKSVGGIVLIARELRNTPPPKAAGKRGWREDTSGALEHIVHPLLQQELAGGSKRKVTFSFRCFGIPRKTIRSLYRSSKAFLRAKGIPSRYIGNERHPAKPGTLLLRGIPGPGCCELVILRDEGQDARTVPERRRAGGAPAEGSGATGSVWVGATCAVQDIEAYTERDIGKPHRDMRTGLLPPKLAQVMLNLGLLLLPQGTARNQKPAVRGPDPSTIRQAHGGERSRTTSSGSPRAESRGEGSSRSGPEASRGRMAGPERETRNPWEHVTIWDPFCGSGVLALEALLRRAHVLASDKSERAVKQCEENIAWLRHREKTPKAVTHAVFKHNACKPCLPAGAQLFPRKGWAEEGERLPREPSLIVTETSLGPALTRHPTKVEIKKLIRDAEELERKFFTTIASSFPGIPVVASFPVYIARDSEQHFLPKILTDIVKLGYRLTFPGNKAIRMTARHTLLYLRPDQHVGHEIVCLLPPRRAYLPRAGAGEMRVPARRKQHAG